MKDVQIEGLYQGYMIKASLKDDELGLSYNKYFTSKDKFKEYLIKMRVNYRK